MADKTPQTEKSLGDRNRQMGADRWSSEKGGGAGAGRAQREGCRAPGALGGREQSSDISDETRAATGRSS